MKLTTSLIICFFGFVLLNLGTAVGSGREMQDSGSKSCISRPDPTAVPRLNSTMLQTHSSHNPKLAHGYPGSVGPKGTTGPVGPQGPQGSASTETFASVSLESPQVVVPQTAVIFDQVHVIEGDISYNNTTGEFTLMQPGYYQVKYGLSGSPNNKQIALQLNGGTLVPGSTIDIQSNIMQGLDAIFEAAAAMSTLRLINNEPSGSLILGSSSEGSTDAYFLIEKL